MNAVIFDMDGVLIDSYQAHMESWVQTAREHEIHIDEGKFASRFGRTSREIIASYWQGRSLGDSEILAIDDRKEAAFREIIRHQVPVMPGAKALIEELKRASFLIAIGSSGPPENVELAINGLEIRNSLSAVVTGRDVRKGKPDPQVFLLAADRMSVDPGKCVVVEDAPPGIQAARAAGMKCIALLSTGRKREDFRAYPPDVFVSELRELNVDVIRDLLK
ncbi:MAG TPA: HAD family phosphatase [Phycisphaerales bacterium]|nr:HAD family phosphatase [Phycisphaerales bacterium]